MTTPKIDLAEIAESQSSKYVTHNEALRDLDVLVQPNIISREVDVPTSTFSEGNAYIITSAVASGTWNNQLNNIAYYYNSTWEIVSAVTDGWTVQETTTGQELVYIDGEWRPNSIKALTSINVSAGQTSVNLDLTLSDVFHVVLQANASVDFINPPVAGKVGKFTILLDQDGTGSRSFNIISNTIYASGAASTVSQGANEKDIWTYLTYTSGDTWYGKPEGLNFL